MPAQVTNVTVINVICHCPICEKSKNQDVRKVDDPVVRGVDNAQNVIYKLLLLFILPQLSSENEPTGQCSGHILVLAYALRKS